MNGRLVENSLASYNSYNLRAMQILGIDIGGSGIKGAIPDTETGLFVSERHRIPTPPSRTPNDIAKVVHEMEDHFD